MEYVLTAKNLIKCFNGLPVVDGISFSLREGEILGLLGPNGAGKTTTIQILLGVLTPTEGDVLYFGRNLKYHRSEILERVNFSSTYTNLPWDLSVRENLTFVSYLYSIKSRRQRVREMISAFRLEELAGSRISELSAGQITRVNLAKAFLNDPKILLLDEPTASLDPDVAGFVRQYILKKQKERKLSIIFTSHNMAEVEEICDRVIFLNQGKIIADNAPEQLARSIELCHVELLVSKGAEEFKSYCRNRNLPLKKQGRYFSAEVKEQQIADFLKDLAGLHIHYEEISIDKPSLEDYFLSQAQRSSNVIS